MSPAQHNGALSSTQRINIAIDVARGISWLHTGNKDAIVHRDIKPSVIHDLMLPLSCIIL